MVTDRGRLAAARVVVTAGAWAPGLAGAAFGTRLRVLRQVLYWFGVDEPALYAPERCPVFIWLHGSGGQRASMYGFPMIDGVAGPKVASEQDTVESDPDRVDRQVAEDDAKSVYEDHARGRLRGITAAGAAHRDLPLHQHARRLVPGAAASRVRRRSPSSRPARATASSIRRRSAKRWRSGCWAGRLPVSLDPFLAPPLSRLPTSTGRPRPVP